jgi:hypothetical protein
MVPFSTPQPLTSLNLGNGSPAPQFARPLSQTNGDSVSLSTGKIKVRSTGQARMSTKCKSQKCRFQTKMHQNKWRLSCARSRRPIATEGRQGSYSYSSLTRSFRRSEESNFIFFGELYAIRDKLWRLSPRILDYLHSLAPRLFY